MVQDSLLSKVFSTILELKLIDPGSHIIVGLSGGPDSVFLLHALHHYSSQNNITLTAAHLDHQWRSDSAKDVQFCQNLCTALGVRFIPQKIENLATSFKFNGSREEMGRKYRRFFFEQLFMQEKADAIALAHHADDQQETFFIRLLRGASLSGLTGMKVRDAHYIRPLLTISKSEILYYLFEHSIPYCTDESNESDAYLRNRVRNMVIPALHKVDARFATTFTQTMKRLQQTEEFLDQLTEQTYIAITKNDAIRLKIHVPSLLALHDALQYRIIMKWLCYEKVSFSPSQSFFDELLRFLKNNNNGKHTITAQWHIEHKNVWASIQKHF